MAFTEGELEITWRARIKELEESDVASLALRFSGKKDLPVHFLLRQIKGLQTAKYKLPDWYLTPGIVYPDTLILEQCSSSATAAYKSTLVDAKRIADLTGGLGVDSVAFAKVAKEVLYVEPDSHRCETATHNFSCHDCSNIAILQSRAEDAIEQIAAWKPDLIYLDPSRRNEQKKKVFRIEELQPDVMQLKEQLLKIAPKILVKFAPMLDITEGLRQLPETSQVHIVSWKGECRELLFLLEGTSKNIHDLHIQGRQEMRTDKTAVSISTNGNQLSPDVLISCIELEGNFPVFTFSSSEYGGLPDLSAPLKFLYEPNAAVSKSGAWKALSAKYKVQALHPNTHLFTSEEKVPFPGRVFEMLEILPHDERTIKAALPTGKAQLVFRNFPVDAAKVVKKLKIPSGEPYYLFFVTINTGEAKVILSRRS